MGNEGQRIATHGYCGGKICKKKPLEICKRRWEVILKYILKKQEGHYGDWINP